MIYDAVECVKATLGKLCRTTCLPPVAILEVIFYTYFCFLPNLKPICSGCNQRWQWHLSTLPQPLHECNDLRTLAQSQMHSHAQMCKHTFKHEHTGTSMCHPYVHATCPFLTSGPTVLPDKLIHLASVHGRYHQHTGGEVVVRHI